MRRFLLYVHSGRRSALEAMATVLHEMRRRGVRGVVRRGHGGAARRGAKALVRRGTCAVLRGSGGPGGDDDTVFPGPIRGGFLHTLRRYSAQSSAPTTMDASHPATENGRQA